jgi:ABC-type transport system substrate-binding protein
MNALRPAPIAVVLLAAVAGSLLARGGFEGTGTVGPAVARPAAPETRAPTGKIAADIFHPDAQAGPDGVRPAQPAPALGGSVTVHVPARPKQLNSSLDGSSSSRRLLLELHESLLRQDWEDWTMQPSLARAWTVEDQLVLSDEAAQRLGARARVFERVLRGALGDAKVAPAADRRERVAVVYGALEDLGERWRVTPRSRGNPLGEALDLDKHDVREVVRGGVATFELRDDVLWHPSPGFEAHRFDAQDVLFSFGIFANEKVSCDERRYQYQKVALAEGLDAHGVRFFLARQDAWAVDDLGEMCILPRHLFDRLDPDNPDHDPKATPEECARYINENPHNQEWIGLGPYRLTNYGDQVIEAERFAGYFDPARAGYLAQLRWRAIQSDAAALQGLLSGEIDVFDRLKAEDYLGTQLSQPPFSDRLYRAWTALGNFAYICWNVQRPQLADARVRRALSHCLDLDDLLATWYGGLGNRVTGPAPFHSPSYDHSIPAPSFDLELAREELQKAGWYDRDGDGWVDHDGERMRIEFAAIVGADFTRHVGLLLQENLKRIGVELDLREVEWATFREAIQVRAYDAFSQGWLPPLEPDPEQLWHSRWGAPGVKSANYPGLQDAAVDELIERGQRELDPAARQVIWHALHARLAELAPFLWLANPATKMALPRAVRGVQLFQLDPGYSLRRWYYPVGTPGTEPAGAVGYWAALASKEPR